MWNEVSDAFLKDDGTEKNLCSCQWLLQHKEAREKWKESTFWEMVMTEKDQKMAGNFIKWMGRSESDDEKVQLWVIEIWFIFAMISLSASRFWTRYNRTQVGKKNPIKNTSIILYILLQIEWRLPLQGWHISTIAHVTWGLWYWMQGAVKNILPIQSALSCMQISKGHTFH